MTRPAWALACLLPALAGCVTIEATIRGDDTASFEMTYRAAHDDTEFRQKRHFSSPWVHVESVKISETLDTVLRATVDDVTRLSTAPGFALVDVQRSREGEDERLDIRLRNPAPKPVAPDEAPWIRIGLTLPGAVRRANHDAVVAGTHVAWSVSRSEFARNPATVLTVRWRPAPPRVG